MRLCLWNPVPWVISAWSWLYWEINLCLHLCNTINHPNLSLKSTSFSFTLLTFLSSSTGAVRSCAANIRFRGWSVLSLHPTFNGISTRYTLESIVHVRPHRGCGLKAMCCTCEWRGQVWTNATGIHVKMCEQGKPTPASVSAAKADYFFIDSQNRRDGFKVKLFDVL